MQAIQSDFWQTYRQIDQRLDREEAHCAWAGPQGGLVGQVTPYVERKNILEKALQQSPKNMICVTSIDGEILLADGGFLPASGMSNQDVVGKNLTTLFGQDEWTNAREKILHGANEVTFLCRHSAGDPSRFTGLWVTTYTPYLSTSGRAIQGIVVNAVKIDNVEPIRKLRSCPLGACMVEGNTSTPE